MQEAKRIRHTVVTGDWIALDKIQSQNLQYLVESILEVCKSNNSNKAIEIEKLKIVRDSVKNVPICKKKHMKLYIIKSIKI